MYTDPFNTEMFPAPQGHQDEARQSNGQTIAALEAAQAAHQQYLAELEAAEYEWYEGQQLDLDFENGAKQCPTKKSHDNQ